MTTLSVIPAELQAGDRMVSANGYPAFGEVLSVDRVDPKFVRYIVRTDKGDYYRTAHPSHTMTVERA